MATAIGSTGCRSGGVLGRAHLQGSSKLGLAWGLGDGAGADTGGSNGWVRGGHVDVDDHAGLKVLVARYEDVFILILEDQAGALVQTIEVLDGGDDGGGVVVGRDHDSHGQTSTVLGLGEDEDKSDLLLLFAARRGSARSSRGGG